MKLYFLDAFNYSFTICISTSELPFPPQTETTSCLSSQLPIIDIDYVLKNICYNTRHSALLGHEWLSYSRGP